MQEFFGIETSQSPNPDNLTDEEFALEALRQAAETDPVALLTLADLAIAGDVEAELVLVNLWLDAEAYRQAIEENLLMIPQLALLAEIGCGNVHQLLEYLVATGPQEFFFYLAGAAAEGCRAAFTILNETATAESLTTLLSYSENYATDPVCGPILARVLQNLEFFPKVLRVALDGDADAGALVARLAEAGNAFAQDWVRVPKAVGYH